LTPEERGALLAAKFALFRTDAAASEISERFSQLLLAFAGATLALFFDKLDKAQLQSETYVGWAAALLCTSLLCGAAQLVLAHIAALVRKGFSDEAQPGSLAAVLNKLDQPHRERVFRLAMTDLMKTRFWPEKFFLQSALAAPTIAEGVSATLQRLQRIMQWQALLFRLQLLSAVAAALPLAIAFWID